MGIDLRKGLFVLLLACSPLRAAEVAGVRVEESVKVAGADLKLNGAGLRRLAFFKVYAMGFYLPEKRSTGNAAISTSGPKRIHLHMLRDIDADDFSEALEAGIKANHSDAEVKALAPRIGMLTTVMNEIRQAKTGMDIDLDWVPGFGTQVTIGGQARGKPIEGEDFYRALLRIWLGDKPVSGDLKKALLGQVD